jgi:hypothetical protein
MDFQNDKIKNEIVFYLLRIRKRERKREREWKEGRKKTKCVF